MDHGSDGPIDLEALHQPSFEVATVMYRLAIARCRRAGRMATEHTQTGRSERRLREIDAVIETIVLAQAACESWIFGAYGRTRAELGTGGGWPQRWLDAPRLICDQKKPLKPP